MHNSAKVAYLSMEIGIEGISAAGGLGFLAGDFLKSCADIGLPVVGVTLLYNSGNFHQKLSDDGQQTEWYDRFDPTGRMLYRHTDVIVPIENRDVHLNAFEYNIVGEMGIVPIILLDTEGNNRHRPWDDNICNVLYPSGHPYERLTQQQVLGTGGVRTLDKLGYNIDMYHMNEGHSALICLELLRKYRLEDEVRKHVIFTTHTPVSAGFEEFSRELAEQVLNNNIPSRSYMKGLTGSESLNMTRLAMSLSSQHFAVSPLHAQVSKYVMNGFPKVEDLFSIDNGVHLSTWSAPEIQKLYDILTSGEWKINPEKLENVLDIHDETALNVHSRSRERLGEFLCRDPRVKGNAIYDPEKLTIGFARRFAGYKQGTLLFRQPDRLRKLSKDIQIVIAGKSHPQDEWGKYLIKEVFRYMKELGKEVSIWFIEDYDMQIAKYMIRGCDLWLNIPMRLLEASGTSGMKAATNFVPQLSIPDGWWGYREPENGHRLPKGLIEGVTGWSIGRTSNHDDFIIFLNGNEPDKWQRREADANADAESIYTKLEDEIIPLFKNHKIGDGKSWAKVMKGAAAHNASWFNTHRMAREYFEKVYNMPLGVSINRA